MSSLPGTLFGVSMLLLMLVQWQTSVKTDERDKIQVKLPETTVVECDMKTMGSLSPSLAPSLTSLQTLAPSPFELARVLCYPAPQPTVAYMYSGHPRSFANPKVHLSFLQNVVYAFGAQPVFFFYFKVNKITYSDGYATNGKDEAKLSNASRAEVEQVLQLFSPRIVVWAEDEDITGQFNPNCSFYASNGVPQSPLWRFLAQWHGIQKVLFLVLEYQRSNNIQFDWVMRLRPDLLWYYGFKPYCGFNRNIAYNPSVLSEPIPFFDWFLLARGDLAARIFDTLGRYRTCVGDFGWTEGDAVLTALKQEGLLTGNNREQSENFLPGFLVRDCSMKGKDGTYCDGLDIRYFSNNECDNVLLAC